MFAGAQSAAHQADTRARSSSHAGPRHRYAWAIIALAGLGAAVSAYLTWVHYSGALALCAGAGGCETVQASRFATVAGVPVALLGLGLYLTILGAAIWRRLGSHPPIEALTLATFGLALTGVLYSVYLTYLELFVIGAVCPWCVLSALLVSGIFGAAIAEMRELGDG